MDHGLSFFLLLSSIILASAQTPSVPPDPRANFRPSVAVVVGIFSIMFSITFLLLMYAKFCHSAAFELLSRNPNRLPGGLFTVPTHQLHLRSFSGIGKTAIDSLPFFRFSSLKGARHGLECAVCLSKFDDVDLLRLLPMCNHAFHIDCVDRWLESHSTCPLCRYRIDPDDPAHFRYSNRFSSARCDEEELDGAIELFVERERDRNDDDHNLLTAVHKFKHRIIVSDVVFKGRWSDVNSSDIMLLNSDMLQVVSSRRFSPLPELRLEIKAEMGHFGTIQGLANNSTPSRSLISPGNRCMSEITNVPRFQGRSSAADEKVRRLWLPIARRTVVWFAGRERRSAESQQESRGDSNV